MCGHEVPAGQQRSFDGTIVPLTHEPPPLEPPEDVEPPLLLVDPLLVDPPLLLLLVDPLLLLLVEPPLLLVDPLLVDPLLPPPPTVSIDPPHAPTAEDRRTKRNRAEASVRSMRAARAKGVPRARPSDHRGVGEKPGAAAVPSWATSTARVVGSRADPVPQRPSALRCLPMASRIDRLERLAPWAAGILLAAPILLFRYPPMGDLPMHEALVAILRHRGDPTWAPPGLYLVVAPQANQLFHFLAYALSFVCGVTLACKLVVAATVVATPVATARLLRSLGASRWPALLAGPIAIGWTYRWGLVPNLLGFALFVAALPLLEQLARRPSPRTVARATVAAALVFFAHESTALLFAMVGSYFALVRGGALRAVLLRSVPVLATLGLAFVQLRVGSALTGANMQAIGNDYGLDPLARLQILPGAVFGGYDGIRLTVMSAVWLAALVCGAVAKGRSSKQELGVRVALWRYRYAVLALVFFFMFLGFPMSLAGTTLLAHRFLPASCVLLVVACAPRHTTLLRAVLLGVVPLAMLGIQTKSILETDVRHRDLDAVLAHLPDNTAVAQLDLTPQLPSVVAPVPGAANRALTLHGGRMLFALTDMPPNPIYVRADAQWNEPMLRLAHQPYAFLPSHDARRFSYLLARNKNAKYRALAVTALQPEEELVASQGEWDLFRSTLPVVPLDAPDAPLPSPLPETLGERVNRLAHAPREKNAD